MRRGHTRDNGQTITFHQLTIKMRTKSIILLALSSLIIVACGHSSTYTKSLTLIEEYIVKIDSVQSMAEYEQLAKKYQAELAHIAAQSSMELTKEELAQLTEANRELTQTAQKILTAIIEQDILSIEEIKLEEEVEEQKETRRERRREDDEDRREEKVEEKREVEKKEEPTEEPTEAREEE